MRSVGLRRNKTKKNVGRAWLCKQTHGVENTLAKVDAERWHKGEKDRFETVEAL